MRRTYSLLLLTVLISFSFFILNAIKPYTTNLVQALTSWQLADYNNNGQIDADDVNQALAFLGCPNKSNCAGGPGNPVTPPPTPGPGGSWNNNLAYSFGTYLQDGVANARITPADILIHANNTYGLKGGAATGAPSDNVRDNWYSKLPGWTRYFLRGNYDSLINIHNAATVFNMENMYECIGYGPEYIHQAGTEAAEAQTWVPQAKSLAQSFGKCLVYGPAVCDYEIMADPNIDIHSVSDPAAHTQACIDVAPQDNLLEAQISAVAPYVDIWTVQLAKYQLITDRGTDYNGNTFGMNEFKTWMSKWVNWIKTANPNAQVWTQLGAGVLDYTQGNCSAPQPPEYILTWREALIESGVDLVWVMPGQSCQPCPPSPPPGFTCSSDPQDNEFYLQQLEAIRDAIDLSFGP